jgi:hypothetical protein
MITGTYPSQHGAYSLGTKLDERVHTVGEDFGQAGYRTALVVFTCDHGHFFGQHGLFAEMGKEPVPMPRVCSA